jgi:hypothetical protein
MLPLQLVHVTNNHTVKRQGILSGEYYLHKEEQFLVPGDTKK